MKIYFWLILFLSSTYYSQDRTVNYSNLDVALLNEFVLKEVNLLRKKKKVALLTNESLLQPASLDHASYMQENSVLTHFQKSKEKHTPKNRVDFYGKQFSIVGENVQQSYVGAKIKIKRKERIVDSYSELAKLLVSNWEHSPPHYQNIIRDDFKTTFTSIKVSKDGEIYACQLFGGAPYLKPKEVTNEYTYDIYKEKKCKRCYRQPFKGGVYEAKDSVIYFYAERKKDVKKIFRNRKKDGLVADIVLKEQFECGNENQYNGQEGVTGFLLAPVFKRDFNSDSNFYRKKYVWIELGKVPSWVNQDYEVNLTLINKNRTCSNIHFYEFRTEMNLDLKLSLGLDSLSPKYTEQIDDSLVEIVYYDKGKTTISDSTLFMIKTKLEHKNLSIKKIKIEGFSSIEGSIASNKELYLKRAKNLLSIFKFDSISPSLVEVTAKENFNDFRNDVKGTPFNYLGLLNERDLKEKMKDTTIVHSVESILKQHRYSKLTINYQQDKSSYYSLKEVRKDLQNAIKTNNKRASVQLQNILNWYFLKDSLTIKDTALIIPFHKDNIELLLNKSLLKLNIDSLNPNAYFNFENELNKLLILDVKNKKINTLLAVLDFVNMSTSPNDLFTSLKKRKYVDAKIKARLLIAVAYYNDVVLYERNKKVVLLPKIKKYLNPAKLNTDEKFDVARYYSFYYDYKSAYDISRKLIGKTEEINDWVYFLKLIHFSAIKERKKIYIKYFEKIKRYSGKDFCKLFHTPMLNFQILEDAQIKKLYCETCQD